MHEPGQKRQSIRSVFLRACLVVIGSPTFLCPQAPPQLSFEVASVKRNLSGEARVSQTLQPGGRYVAINIPLRMLIMRAYRLSDFRLSGTPPWIDTERYDIVGLAPGATDPDEITPRLQSLLADRFKLAAHMEEKDVPVFWLVRARNDGRLGPEASKVGGGLPATLATTGLHHEAHADFRHLGRLIHGRFCQRVFTDHGKDCL